MTFEYEWDMINKATKSRALFLIIIGVLFSFVATKAVSEEKVLTGIHHQVEISSFSFIPAELKVKVGDTITWTNNDIVPHNIVDSTHLISASPNLKTGESYRLVIEESLLYLCGLHPSMTGKILLTRSP
jgi:plastocyanin